MPTTGLPETDLPPLLRTDFTDDAAWRALLDEIGDDRVTAIADPAHQGLSVPELVALVPGGSVHPVLVVADDRTFSSVGRSLLLVDVVEEPGRTFRVAVPDALRSVVGNLEISNSSFDDYLDSDSFDHSGVYQLSDRHYQARAALQGHRPTAPVSVSAPIGMTRRGPSVPPDHPLPPR
ncbi:hypothetical protein [Pseudonocardia sp. MH-G8]|uniref:DUF6924 domain-containing protein n=1 Tax=Pseudonocardia sp. MH-G8 TaxID=1854588 RepID=UPI000BA04517|nr:hypothetical protein [Pseudonocardia sp. MH-G8]OZM78577.1 hypothetical protein CFP66_30120 [Pseudonocardia sp. MH-G8]